ncbi:MAG: O-antigen ligase family protein [Cellvibrio sp.]
MPQLGDRWNSFATRWMSFGVYFFVISYFWASGVAGLRSSFYLFLLLPALLFLPWKKAHWKDFGGVFTGVALLMTGYIVLSNLWASENHLSKLFRSWMLIAIWLAIASFLVVRGHLNVDRLLKYMVIAGVVAAIGEIIYFYGILGHPLGLRLRAHGVAENSTLTGQVFGAVAIVAYVKSLQSAERRDMLLWFCAAGICGLALLLSQTRGAILAFGLVAITSLILCRPSKKIVSMQVGVALVAVATLFVQFNLAEIIGNRGLDLSDRDLLWRALLARTYENAFFGIGALYDPRIIVPDVDVFHHAHNPWIDTVYYAGLVGLFIALCHLQLVLQTFCKHRQILPLFMWFVFGCLCLFTNAPHLLMSINAFWFAYWIPAGLLVGAHLLKIRTEAG